MTVAPRSASSIEQNGPATTRVMSSTTSPASGPVRVGIPLSRGVFRHRFPPRNAFGEVSDVNATDVNRRSMSNRVDGRKLRDSPCQSPPDIVSDLLGPDESPAHPSPDRRAHHGRLPAMQRLCRSHRPRRRRQSRCSGHEAPYGRAGCPRWPMPAAPPYSEQVQPRPPLRPALEHSSRRGCLSAACAAGCVFVAPPTRPRAIGISSVPTRLPLCVDFPGVTARCSGRP